MAEQSEGQQAPPPSPESGDDGDRPMAQDAANKIIERWAQKERQPSEHPFFLIVGGVQGSGKTSALEELAQTTDFVPVSPDEIRWIMFGENYFLTQETGTIWRDTVHLARNIIIQEAMKRGLPIALDQSMNPERLKYLKELAQKFPQYRTMSVLLNPPDDVLRNRVKTRKHSYTKYQGNIQELEGTMNMPGVRDPSLFDLTIDKSNQTPKQVAAQIQDLINLKP